MCTSSPRLMCQGVGDTVFCSEVVVAVPLELLICVNGFPVYRG